MPAAPSASMRAAAESKGATWPVGGSKSETAQPGMIVGPPTERPVIFSVILANWQIVDTSVTHRHQALFVKLSVFIAERAEPISRIVMSLISEANGDPIVLKCPELLDQAVIETSSSKFASRCARPIPPAT